MVEVYASECSYLPERKLQWLPSDVSQSFACLLCGLMSHYKSSFPLSFTGFSGFVPVSYMAYMSV